MNVRSLETVCPLVALLLLLHPIPSAAQSLDRQGQAWDLLEWSLDNSSLEGNPFDLIATATFRHAQSGQRQQTPMFYDGEHRWRFRFTPTLTGNWMVETVSDDPELSGHRGIVHVTPGPGPEPHGFVSHDGNRWLWSGSGRAFVPQIVMYRSPDGYYNQPELIDRDLQLWFDQHGFNGLHTSVLCRWFDLEKTQFDQFDSRDPNPDPRTFEALELLITKAHSAGGFVHIWAWGDESRGMTPTGWGINGKADRRLQRYIAARLGPLPGWTMGYGFDLWEWVDAGQLETWHHSLHSDLLHPHLIGGRVHRHGEPLDRLITDQLDYIGYETHRPDFATYVEALERHPEKPVMMEDRFRIRNSPTYREKDYNEELVRRGLWHSAMAGGVGNIWGYLLPDEGPQGMSRPFPNRDQIQTYARFIEDRFPAVSERTADSADVAGLKNADGARFMFYKEECQQMELDLSEMHGAQPAVAVDTLKPYHEFPLGLLAPSRQTVSLPHTSDWAVAISDFSGGSR